MSELQTAERARPAHPIATYSDHGDQHHIELCGSMGHLKNCGLNIDAVPADRDSEVRVTVTGSDGHAWAVWGTDPFGMKASRPRTDAERVEWIDRMNARISSGYFSRDRQSMVCEIAFELYEMADAVASEKPMARCARRALKKKLAVIARVQMSLICREIDMQDLRAQLGMVGMVVNQTAHFN